MRRQGPNPCRYRPRGGAAARGPRSPRTLRRAVPWRCRLEPAPPTAGGVPVAHHAHPSVVLPGLLRSGIRMPLQRPGPQLPRHSLDVAAQRDQDDHAERSRSPRARLAAPVGRLSVHHRPASRFPQLIPTKARLANVIRHDPVHPGSPRTSCTSEHWSLRGRLAPKPESRRPGTGRSMHCQAHQRTRTQLLAISIAGTDTPSML